LGVLKPKTSEGTQAPPKKPILVRCTSVPPACPPAARVPPPPGCAGVPSQRERSWARYAVCGIPVRVCSLIPPTPFSHKVRRGSLGVLMAETGDGTQGLAKKSTPVRYRLGGYRREVYPGRRTPATYFVRFLFFLRFESPRGLPRTAHASPRRRTSHSIAEGCTPAAVRDTGFHSQSSCSLTEHHQRRRCARLQLSPHRPYMHHPPALASALWVRCTRPD